SVPPLRCTVGANHKSEAATKVVVIASSAGGIEALCTLAENLPANLPATIVVAQHISRSHKSHLAEILARHTPMKVKLAADRDLLCHGCVFIAPPNLHVMIEPTRTIRLLQAPPIHFTRPSAEPLFCSA